MRVACCGLTTLDVIHRVERLPGPDEKVQAESALVEFGGPAANAAYTAKVLGADVTLLSAIGHGPVAAVVRAQLRDAGIDLVDVAEPGWDVPVSAVTVTGAHRCVVSRNAVGAPLAALPGDALTGCRALLVDGHHLDLCIAAAEQARASGIPVLFDGGSWKPGLERLLDLVDVAVLSADFPAGVDWGGRPVAVSRGPEPIVLGDVEIQVPVVDVVDTVGAGDVLHGALLVALARGEDLPAALPGAAAVASESCRYPGAHAWAAGRVTTGS